jgi:hypothetical protein
MSLYRRNADVTARGREGEVVQRMYLDVNRQSQGS